jgi:hypothetical protein
MVAQHIAGADDHCKTPALPKIDTATACLRAKENVVLYTLSKLQAVQSPGL